MKVAMRLTMDGLIRALRQQAHRLAEEVEDGTREFLSDDRPTAAGVLRDERRRAREISDDVIGG